MNGFFICKSYLYFSMSERVCVLEQNISVTFLCNGNFNYYVAMKEGSNLIIKSNNGAKVNMNRNIWGPGNLTISCDCCMNASIGQAPDNSAIQGLPLFTYTQNTTEVA